MALSFVSSLVLLGVSTGLRSRLSVVYLVDCISLLVRSVFVDLALMGHLDLNRLCFCFCFFVRTSEQNRLTINWSKNAGCWSGDYGSSSASQRKTVAG